MNAFEPGRTLEAFKYIKSLYELRRTLQLVDANGQRFRIELWYCHTNSNAPWTAYVSIHQDEPSGWQEIPEFPWVEERDEATAIHQAVVFLEESAGNR